MEIEGFEGLLVCSDWTENKKSGAQSLIFCPLLCCAIGQEWPGLCTMSQLEYAVKWWTAIFPSYPNWIEKLREAGIVKACANLPAKGNTVLIPKLPQAGKAPHFKGKQQNDILELDMQVAIEVYASIANLYKNQPEEPKKEFN